MNPLITGPDFCGLVATASLEKIEQALKNGSLATSKDQRGTPAIFYSLQSAKPKAVIELLIKYDAPTPINYFHSEPLDGVIPSFIIVLRNKIHQEPTHAVLLSEILDIPEVKKYLDIQK